MLEYYGFVETTEWKFLIILFVLFQVSETIWKKH